MKKYFSFLVIVSLLFVSCSKEITSDADVAKPEIQVIYPTDIPALSQNMPLCLKVVVEDNRSLYKVWLEVNDGSGFSKEYPLTGRMIDITEKYYSHTGITGNFNATFFATDQAGNTSSRKISFVLNN